MAAPKRTREQRGRDDTVLAEMLAQGRSHAAMAARLGVSRAQVEYDLRRVRAAARRRFGGAVDLVVDQVLKLRHRHALALQAFHRSREVREKSTTEQIGGKDGRAGRLRVVVTRQQGWGDAKYLHVANR